MCVFATFPRLMAEPVEQVLPRQRTEGDDQTGCVENVSTTSILFLYFRIYFILWIIWGRPDWELYFPIFSSFPEIRYFQDEDVRTKLTDILFCYGRENEQLLYKQVGLRCCLQESFKTLLSFMTAYTGYVWMTSGLSQKNRTPLWSNLIIISVCSRCQINGLPMQHLYCKQEVTHGRAAANNIRIKPATLH